MYTDMAKTLYTKQGRVLPCFCYDSLPSTNDEAKRIAKEGREDRFAVAASEQTAGRGRYGREFLSLRGRGLYLSYAMKAEGRDIVAFGALSALAVAALLEEYFGIRAELKWPNDVLVNGRKICGILPESVVGRDGERYAVVGMGVNVFYSEEELGALADIATSAVLCCKNDELKRGFLQNQEATLRSAAVRLAELCSRLADCMDAGEDFIPEYAGRLVTLGKRVRFKGADGREKEGVATGVAPDCSLIVATDGGEEKIGWGEVAVVSE